MNKNLLELIEDHRYLMLSTAKQTSLSSQEVIKISKELDTLLNEYTKSAN